jgi:hypothetical protein
MMGIEKRQSLRKELRVQALLTIDDAATHVFVRTMDIGKFGMGLVGIPRQLTTSQQGLVAFELFLDGEVHNVGVRVRVAYCIPDGGSFRAGFQFLDLDSVGAALIARYVGD